ncbi:hypothetical protein BDW42DRAFT_80312 [Aspergillus taichungensis]|uniref:Uncharacterized protein n=1 Tax=Aspergillus taichungensis TaxID=482145 RepID=A0A2J5HYJ3_9EURO|nr:hypothetical protein BDW42DRAFT_80312 [Aspergillus taichungensis]
MTSPWLPVLHSVPHDWCRTSDRTPLSGLIGAINQWSRFPLPSCHPDQRWEIVGDISWLRDELEVRIGTNWVEDRQGSEDTQSNPDRARSWVNLPPVGSHPLENKDESGDDDSETLEAVLSTTQRNLREFAGKICLNGRRPSRSWITPWTAHAMEPTNLRRALPSSSQNWANRSFGSHNYTAGVDRVDRPSPRDDYVGATDPRQMTDLRFTMHVRETWIEVGNPADHGRDILGA